MSGPAREGVANCGWLPSPFKRGRFSDPQVPPRLPPVRCRQARSPRVKGRALSISIRNASGLPCQAVSTNGATRLIRITWVIRSSNGRNAQLGAPGRFTMCWSARWSTTATTKSDMGISVGKKRILNYRRDCTAKGSRTNYVRRNHYEAFPAAYTIAPSTMATSVVAINRVRRLNRQRIQGVPRALRLRRSTSQ
jgi:hypothetical protein